MYPATLLYVYPSLQCTAFFFCLFSWYITLSPPIFPPQLHFFLFIFPDYPSLTTPSLHTPECLLIVSPEFVFIVSDGLSSSDGSYIMRNNRWLWSAQHSDVHSQTRRPKACENHFLVVFHTHIINIVRSLVIIITSPLCSCCRVSSLFSFISLFHPAWNLK